jgi:hypothetical protein
VFESRGKREDAELASEFASHSGMSPSRLESRFSPHFAAKSAAHAGLELADLVARPIGVHVMRPNQPNRAFDVIQSKLRRSPHGAYEGWGLKVFP